MKSNIVIVPSAVSPMMDVFSAEERFEQTKQTIASARSFIPNSIVILNDISLNPAPTIRKDLADLVDIFIDSNADKRALYYSSNRLKSPGELVLFCEALKYARNNFDFSKVDRIFKLGARCYLRPSFDISVHQTAFRKYVFKAEPSWMNPNTKLYITRLWSMDASLADSYLENEQKMMDCFSAGYDTEHAHYICFQNNTHEVQALHTSCRVAPNGILHED